MSEDVTIAVRGPSPYDVRIGRGVVAALPDVLGPDVRRVAVVHAPELGERARALGERVGEHVAPTLIELPAGEAAKTAQVAVEAWDTLGEAGFTRSDVVVTLGGGATTDMGGFVAATWLRGVRVVHVPTTLLGMVDAAVGGKTGMNTASGKNLVGSFHEPAGVLCDLGFLDTLPAAELVSGLGEVVKCGFVADPVILDLVEADPDAVRDPGSPVLHELVERAIRVKVDVVAGDLRETGGHGGHPGREVLNYGHTMAHAIERATGYAVRHGEAVALGMVYVAALARLAGRLDADTAARHARTLALVGLPTRWDGAPFEELLATMRIDKKSRGATLRFVVLDGLGRPGVLEGPDEDLLRAAYDELAARDSGAPVAPG